MKYKDLYPNMRKARLFLERLGMSDHALTVEIAAARIVELENQIKQMEKSK